MQALRIAHACEVLGISHNASTKEISKAYKELARVHHPDKSSCPQAEEKFKQINEAYETLISMQANMDAEVPMQANMDTEEDPPESTNAAQSAASVKRSAAWLQPEFIPTFEVAYTGPQWHPVNEEISKDMYSAYLANTPGCYIEPLTTTGKVGTREYTVDWQQMIQTNTANGRMRSVRFRELQQDGNRRILTGKTFARSWIPKTDIAIVVTIVVATKHGRWPYVVFCNL